MLDEMKRRHRAQTVVGQASQIRRRVKLDNLEPAALPARNHCSIRFHPTSVQSCFSQQLQPLASAATEIQDVRSDSRFFQKWKINLEAIAHVFDAAAKLICKRGVQIIEVNLLDLGCRRQN